MYAFSEKAVSAFFEAYSVHTSEHASSNVACSSPVEPGCSDFLSRLIPPLSRSVGATTRTFDDCTTFAPRASLHEHHRALVDVVEVGAVAQRHLEMVLGFVGLLRRLDDALEGLAEHLRAMSERRTRADGRIARTLAPRSFTVAPAVTREL